MDFTPKVKPTNIIKTKLDEVRVKLTDLKNQKLKARTGQEKEKIAKAIKELNEQHEALMRDFINEKKASDLTMMDSIFEMSAYENASVASSVNKNSNRQHIIRKPGSQHEQPNDPVIRIVEEVEEDDSKDQIQTKEVRIVSPNTPEKKE